MKLPTVAPDPSVVPPTNWTEELTTTVARLVGKKLKSDVLDCVGEAKIRLLVKGVAVVSETETLDPTPVLPNEVESRESSLISGFPLTVETVYVNRTLSVCPVVAKNIGLTNINPGPSVLAVNVETVIDPGSTAIAPPVGVELKAMKLENVLSPTVKEPLLVIRSFNVIEPALAGCDKKMSQEITATAKIAHPVSRRLISVPSISRFHRAGRSILGPQSIRRRQV
ncbi:MAG: hypothetical protein WBX00_22010 [Isosphaeraceae bacterium]